MHSALTPDRLDQLVLETRMAAACPEHVWDRLALDWPLTSESVVVEVGGYKGRWALQIAERYAPRLFVFEPQPWAAAVCRAVLHGYGAMVLPYALGATSGVMLMGDWETDGCSLLKAGGEHQVEMFEIAAIFRQLGLTQIDLMLMNIEGYEYMLIPHMLHRGILPQRLMVQFHEDVSGPAATADIFAQLEAAGYAVVWTYGAVLTAWERA
jgi:FkbM family methyltransferase